MTKIKILHIVHDFLQGGVESFLYYLTQEQEKNKELKISILCLQKKEDVLNKRIIENNINCFFIQLKPFDINLYKYLKILKLTNEFDIIHFHTFKPLLSFFLHFTKAKKIFTVHSAGDINRPTSFNFKLKNNLFKIVLNKSIDSIANNSNYTKSYWIERGVNKKNNYVIYNGVPELKTYDKENVYTLYPHIKNKFVIGTTSRFINWKRVELLIEAFSLMKNCDKIILILVGAGPEKEKLINYAKEKKVESNTIFTGYKSNVTDYQEAMDICVFPSVSEPFGLVAIECLLLGKPVFVMNDGGGITEILKEIEQNNIANSVNNLAVLLDNAFENLHYFENNKKLRIEKAKIFSVSSTEQQYATLYKNKI